MGRLHSIVLCGPHLIDQLTFCKVGDQIRLQRIVHLCGELLILLHPAFQLCGKLCRYSSCRTMRASLVPSPISMRLRTKSSA